MPDHRIDENEVLRDALSGLTTDVPPMPEGLHAAWMQQVEEDKQTPRTRKPLNTRAITHFLSIAAALVFVVGGTLLTRDDPAFSAPAAKGRSVSGAPQVVYSDAAPEADYDGGVPAGGYTYTTATNGAPMMMASGGARSTGAADAPVAAQSVTEKKIIRTASLTIHTQAFELSLANLRALCEAEGGWIESSSESTSGRTGLRTAYLTLRIPQEALDGFLAGTADCGRITSRSETATDVTASYQDTQTRLATQLALMDRLQALIPESASLADLLALESQIADTQYQIDMLTSMLADTDRQVAYSTVTITLQEETTPAITDGTVSLGERLMAAAQTGFGAMADFAGDMLVFLVAAAPFIGALAALVAVIMLIRRLRRRNV